MRRKVKCQRYKYKYKVYLTLLVYLHERLPVGLLIRLCDLISDLQFTVAVSLCYIVKRFKAFEAYLGLFALA